MQEDKLSELIKQQRKKLGLTQEKLAKKLHVTNKAVSRWETGKRYPDIGTLTLLIKILNLNYEEVFDPNGYVVNQQKKQQKKIKLLLIMSIICCSILGILLIQKSTKQLIYK
ncbi:MAG: helix-turn-helix transcriptional regulator [Coprobacillaceae bacterium]